MIFWRFSTRFLCSVFNVLTATAYTELTVENVNRVIDRALLVLRFKMIEKYGEDATYKLQSLTVSEDAVSKVSLKGIVDFVAFRRYGDCQIPQKGIIFVGHEQPAIVTSVFP